MKKIILLLSVCTLLYSDVNASSIKIAEVKCESQHNPLGIQSEKPLLSWVLSASERNVTQTAYQVLVSDNLSQLSKNNGNIWNSGKMISDQSINILYSGTALKPATIYYWKVRVWDNKGNVSKWSEAASFQMGLLKDSDWGSAKWIALQQLDPKDRIVPGFQFIVKTPPALATGKEILPQFRKSFTVEKKIKNATAFISGLGHFEMSVNGSKIGDHFLDPGWSNYDSTSFYLTFDITKQLQKGENVVGIRLGNGFLHIPRDTPRYKKIYATFALPKTICKILITYNDGSTKEINSGTDWKGTASPFTFSSIYGGEEFDATLEKEGWDKPGYDDRNWQQPIVVPPTGKLLAQLSPPLKIHETFKTIQITQPKPGIYVYDFGQNASAIMSLKVTGPKGAKVIMRPAEYLTKDGLADQRGSGRPNWYSYTLSGNGVENWQPAFSYYGFRYIQVEGALPEGKNNPDRLPVIKELSSLHVRNSSDSVGAFNCSNDLFNRIYNLILWSVKSNMASVLTDCPHREKLGWLEVPHLMASSIGYCYDIRQMYMKVIEDMKAAQLPNGMIPNIAPEFVNYGGDFRDSPEWGSAGIQLPWFIYKWYGDKSILASSYDMMERYIKYLDSRTKDNLLYHGLGDWFDLGPKHPGYSQLTSKGFTPSAIYYDNLLTTARVSALLGYTQKEKYYNDMAQKVKESFNKKFFNTEKGYYDQGSQTANAMALYLGLAAPEHKANMLKQIVSDIRQRGNGMTSGDVGFSYLLRVLEMENQSQVIFDMNNQKEKPGYAYQLEQGATALTESWNALKSESHNHCMLGHLLEWFYSGLGGIKTNSTSVAFKHFEINPALAGDINEVNVKFNSPSGEIKCHTLKSGNKYIYNVVVPVNTTADIYFNTTNKNNITENGQSISSNPTFQFVKIENNKCVYTIGSGSYTFTAGD